MDKNTKKDLKAIAGEKLTVDDKITIKELEEQIKSMKEDKEKKCKSAKEQLVDMLKVTADKYCTATGTAEALRTLRFVTGYDCIHPIWANRLAWDMAAETDRMREKAESLPYAEMDKLCDGFYKKEFKIDSNNRENFDDGVIVSDVDVLLLAYEMMRIDLCRNVGGAAEDMVEFVKHTQEGIDACGEKLKELKAKEK